MFIRLFENCPFVKSKFSDALLNILKGSVLALFSWNLLICFRVPSPAELLDSANIHNSVMKVIHELWHVLVQKLFVCMDTVSSQWALFGRGVLFYKIQECLFRL